MDQNAHLLIRKLANGERNLFNRPQHGLDHSPPGTGTIDTTV